MHEQCYDQLGGFLVFSTFFWILLVILEWSRRKHSEMYKIKENNTEISKLKHFSTTWKIRSKINNVVLCFSDCSISIQGQLGQENVKKIFTTLIKKKKCNSSKK